MSEKIVSGAKPSANSTKKKNQHPERGSRPERGVGHKSEPTASTSAPRAPSPAGGPPGAGPPAGSRRQGRRQRSPGRGGPPARGLPGDARGTVEVRQSHAGSWGWTTERPGAPAWGGAGGGLTSGPQGAARRRLVAINHQYDRTGCLRTERQSFKFSPPRTSSGPQVHETGVHRPDVLLPSPSISSSGTM